MRERPAAGVPGYNHAVSASTNRREWTPLQTNVPRFPFTDPSAGGFVDRFYRAQYLL
jgi:hypothetical protein